MFHHQPSVKEIVNRGKQAQGGTVPKSVKEACHPIGEYNGQVLRHAHSLLDTHEHTHKQEIVFSLSLTDNSGQPIKENKQGNQSSSGVCWQRKIRILQMVGGTRGSDKTIYKSI